MPIARHASAPLRWGRDALRPHHGELVRRAQRLFPSDWTTGPPDFVGIGVQRAGTTWWYELICAHPGVFRLPLTPKERHAFGDYATEPSPGGAERYHALFPRPPARLTGEWTPRYMLDPWTPRLLAAAAPQARLLAILRDPIDRFRSAHKSDRHATANETTLAFERGFYARQLDRVLAHFDREQLLVLQYERCRVAPEEELARTYTFLGLDPTFVPEGLRRPVNAPSRAPVELSPHVLETLRDAYRPEAAALAGSFPEIDLALWRTLAGT